MHWKTLKIVTVVALLASPSAIAAIPAQGVAPARGAIEGAVTAAESTLEIQLAHHRGGRHGRFDRGRGRGDGDRHYGHGRGRHHPHFRYHHHRPRHFHGPRHRHFRGRPIRRLFRHWLRHHY